MRREAEIRRVKLPAETVRKALRDRAEKGVEAALFTGGEPSSISPKLSTCWIMPGL
ncbi:MAG: hypothetical protein LBD47_05905 [Treponema sp.]|jgi:2-iminoacetate synthase ThiH|nr:hypothetical protein [Treponema sp.]